MRAVSRTEVSELSPNDKPLERMMQAAQLLREALALLAHERATSSGRGPDRLLRLPEVQRLTGLSRSAIYQQMQGGIFPKSVKTGPRAASWSEASIQAWIADRLDGSILR
jgi:prophage regulatory protein